MCVCVCGGGGADNQIWSLTLATIWSEETLELG
jgi:hypothetical protein